MDFKEALAPFAALDRFLHLSLIVEEAIQTGLLSGLLITSSRHNNQVMNEDVLLAKLVT